MSAHLKCVARRTKQQKLLYMATLLLSNCFVLKRDKLQMFQQSFILELYVKNFVFTALSNDIKTPHYYHIYVMHGFESSMEV